MGPLIHEHNVTSYINAVLVIQFISYVSGDSLNRATLAIYENFKSG